MNVPLTRMWSVTVGLLVAVAAGVGIAQQGFPLRPGDWEVTTKSSAGGAPIVQHFCYTAETWLKGLTQNPTCTIQGLSVTSKGMHYVLNCALPTAVIKGPVDVTFDGMEHMVGQSSITTTMSGKTSSSQVVTEQHWKGAACTAADVNMKKTG